MKILRFTSMFFLICLLNMCGCSKLATDWERLYQTEGEDTEDLHEEGQSTKEKADAQVEIATVQVHVCGAVVSPGVYELPKGARVNQAIEAAGGLTEEADVLLVNQARIVEDGEQIRIYTKEEALDAKIQSDIDARVNINAADASVLMTLPGIGEAKATAIIEYREANGGFKTIDDIMNIPGIKEAVFSKIKDKITV